MIKYKRYLSFKMTNATIVLLNKITRAHKEYAMFSFIKRRLLNEEGAMDKIIVTLLLVVVGVAAVVGLSTWMSTQSDTIKTSAESEITSVTGETN